MLFRAAVNSGPKWDPHFKLEPLREQKTFRTFAGFRLSFQVGFALQLQVLGTNSMPRARTLMVRCMYKSNHMGFGLLRVTKQVL